MQRRYRPLLFQLAALSTAGAAFASSPAGVSDCGADSSNPTAAWNPGPTFTIRVAVHVLQDDSCTLGALSDALVASQIAVLNEDFGALAGTPGAAGVDSGQGAASAEVIYGAAERGFVGKGYQQVFTDYQTVAEQVMQQDEIPPGYRFYVRRYFQLIRPRD